MFERGRAHPVLGPILLVVLVVLLAMLFLHVVLDGNPATEIGAVVCLALATALGLPLLERLRSRLSQPLVSVRGDRAPPAFRNLRLPRPAVVFAGSRNLPLRR